MGTALTLLIGVGPMMTLAQDPQPAPDRVVIERERSMQGPEARMADKITIERSFQGPQGPMPPPPPGDFIFLATEMSFGGKLVKGIPYSAEAVTESTQTLSDGNRIINKTTASIYRDSEGRTRREQTFNAIGPFAKAGEPHQTIYISDPVAGTAYTLDPKSRIARKVAPFRFKMAAPPPPHAEGKPGVRHEGPTKFEFKIQPDDKVMHKRAAEAGVKMGWVRNNNARVEDLGKQNVEGVEAEGKRTTVTIPAGEIGNERPIEIVSERWYSPELQTIVMTRHSDPRFGENSYRLTNINRSEPSPLLFGVPVDYTVQEELKPGMKIRRAAPPPQQ
jgi:hypothetical protein